MMEVKRSDQPNVDTTLFLVPSPISIQGSGSTPMCLCQRVIWVQQNQVMHVYNPMTKKEIAPFTLESKRAKVCVVRGSNLLKSTGTGKIIGVEQVIGQVVQDGKAKRQLHVLTTSDTATESACQYFTSNKKSEEEPGEIVTTKADQLTTCTETEKPLLHQCGSAETNATKSTLSLPKTISVAFPTVKTISILPEKVNNQVGNTTFELPSEKYPAISKLIQHEQISGNEVHVQLPGKIHVQISGNEGQLPGKISIMQPLPDTKFPVKFIPSQTPSGKITMKRTLKGRLSTVNILSHSHRQSANRNQPKIGVASHATPIRNVQLGALTSSLIRVNKPAEKTSMTGQTLPCSNQDAPKQTAPTTILAGQTLQNLDQSAVDKTENVTSSLIRENKPTEKTSITGQTLPCSNQDAPKQTAPTTILAGQTLQNPDQSAVDKTENVTSSLIRENKPTEKTSITGQTLPCSNQDAPKQTAPTTILAGQTLQNLDQPAVDKTENVKEHITSDIGLLNDTVNDITDDLCRSTTENPSSTILPPPKIKQEPAWDIQEYGDVSAFLQTQQQNCKKYLASSFSGLDDATRQVGRSIKKEFPSVKAGVHENVENILERNEFLHQEIAVKRKEFSTPQIGAVLENTVKDLERNIKRKFQTPDIATVEKTDHVLRSIKQEFSDQEILKDHGGPPEESKLLVPKTTTNLNSVPSKCMEKNRSSAPPTIRTGPCNCPKEYIKDMFNAMEEVQHYLYSSCLKQIATAIQNPDRRSTWKQYLDTLIFMKGKKRKAIALESNDHDTEHRDHSYALEYESDNDESDNDDATLSVKRQKRQPQIIDGQAPSPCGISKRKSKKRVGSPSRGGSDKRKMKICLGRTLVGKKSSSKVKKLNVFTNHKLRNICFDKGPHIVLTKLNSSNLRLLGCNTSCSNLRSIEEKEGKYSVVDVKIENTEEHYAHVTPLTNLQDLKHISTKDRISYLKGLLKTQKASLGL